jgi:hypothetical protein
MDMPSKYQHSSVVSKVDWFYQPDTPPEAEVDNASTSALAAEAICATVSLPRVLVSSVGSG